MRLSEYGRRDITRNNQNDKTSRGVMSKKRYTVLTYIIGNSEIVHEIGEKDPDAEYLMVTDNPDLKSDTWEVILDETLQGPSMFDKGYSIQYNCFQYCHTDICLRLDASVEIYRSTKWLIDEFEKGMYHMALMPHPVRSTVREEYDAWVNMRNYPQEQAERCMASMAEKGCDLACRGLYQVGFVIMRRNEQTSKLNKEVLDWLKELGTDGKIERLDQTVFSCVVNMKYSHLKVLPISEQLFHSEMMAICVHGTDIEDPGRYYDLFTPDEKYIFNRLVRVRYFMVGGKETRELRRLYSQVENLGSAIWALTNQEG